MSSYFEDYEAVVQQYVPNYENIFINLHQMPSAQIMNLRNGMLRSALLIQQICTDAEELMKNIGQIFQSLNPYLEQNFIDTIFVYLVQVLDTDKATLVNKLVETSQTINEKIMSIYDQLIQEGLTEGIKKGIEKTILNAFTNQIPLDQIDNGRNPRKNRGYFAEKWTQIATEVSKRPLPIQTSYMKQVCFFYDCF